MQLEHLHRAGSPADVLMLMIVVVVCEVLFVATADENAAMNENFRIGTLRRFIFHPTQSLACPYPRRHFGSF